jgi:hypothetical protein
MKDKSAGGGNGSIRTLFDRHATHTSLPMDGLVFFTAHAGRDRVVFKDEKGLFVHDDHGRQVHLAGSVELERRIRAGGQNPVPLPARFGDAFEMELLSTGLALDEQGHAGISIQNARVDSTLSQALREFAQAASGLNAHSTGTMNAPGKGNEPAQPLPEEPV